jgi:hypothetical protein
LIRPGTRPKAVRPLCARAFVQSACAVLVVAEEPNGDTHYGFVLGEFAMVAGDEVHDGASVRGELGAEHL